MYKTRAIAFRQQYVAYETRPVACIARLVCGRETIEKLPNEIRVVEDPIQSGGIAIRNDWIAIRSDRSAIRNGWIAIRNDWIVIRSDWIAIRNDWIVIRSDWIAIRNDWIVIRA